MILHYTALRRSVLSYDVHLQMMSCICNEREKHLALQAQKARQAQYTINNIPPTRSVLQIFVVSHTDDQCWVCMQYIPKTHLFHPLVQSDYIIDPLRKLVNL